MNTKIVVHIIKNVGSSKKRNLSCSKKKTSNIKLGNAN